MVAVITGTRRPNEKGRVTLSVRSPLVTSLLAGLGIEKANMEEAHAFGNRLVHDRNSWDIARRKIGLFGEKKLSKAQAEEAWARSFSATQRGGGNVR